MVSLSVSRSSVDPREVEAIVKYLFDLGINGTIPDKYFRDLARALHPLSIVDLRVLIGQVGSFESGGKILVEFNESARMFSKLVLEAEGRFFRVETWQGDKRVGYGPFFHREGCLRDLVDLVALPVAEEREPVEGEPSIIDLFG